MMLKMNLLKLKYLMLEVGKMKSYGMFTPEGNTKVAHIVEFARAHDLDWPSVLPVLRYLAWSDLKFGEAMDTVVREAVYTELNFS